MVFFGAMMFSGASVKASEENKPVVSRTAPLQGGVEINEPSGQFGSNKKESLPVFESSSTAVSTTSISEEIHAAPQDQVPLDVEPPPLNLPFKEVVSFSRPGQTDRVLTAPLDHLPANELLGLSVLDPRQGWAPSFFSIPRPPFIHMEVPSGVDASQWTFRVEDQSESVLYRAGGLALPQDIVAWDGFIEGRMALKPGVVYLPVLELTTKRGGPQQYFGEPLQLDAMEYEEGATRRFEVHNTMMFSSRSHELSPPGRPLVVGVLNQIRSLPITPIDVVVYEDDQGSVLAAKRAGVIQRFLEDALVSEPGRVRVRSSPVGDRGSVTSFSVVVSTGVTP